MQEIPTNPFVNQTRSCLKTSLLRRPADACDETTIADTSSAGAAYSDWGDCFSADGSDGFDRAVCGAVAVAEFVVSVTVEERKAAARHARLGSDAGCDICRCQADRFAGDDRRCRSGSLDGR